MQVYTHSDRAGQHIIYELVSVLLSDGANWMLDIAYLEIYCDKY